MIEEAGDSITLPDAPSTVPGNLENAGVKSTSMVVNLSTIIFAIGIFIIFLLISKFFISALKTDKWAIKLKAWLKNFKKKMHFNGLIDALTLAYVNLCSSTAI